MRIIFKTLLASSFLVLTVSDINAEQAIGINSQGPSWDLGQVPIAWGDCIPVPVAPSMMPPMGMGAAPMPAPFPQGAMPYPGNPAFSAPPPSPFYNAIPAPMPLPMTALPTPVVAEPVCDNNNSNAELHALQGKYNQAAAASKAKIEEITQAMEDAQNQMVDARVIIENLSKEQEADRAKIASFSETQKNFESDKVNLESNLKKASTDADDKLTKLKLDFDATVKERKGLQEQLSAFGQTDMELSLLKGAYRLRSKENDDLKKRLASLKVNAGAQAQKLTALGQSTTELTALKGAYQIRNNENVDLKKRLAEFDNANKSLQTKLSSLEANAGAQARKLTALGQSSTELVALKSAYRERNDEAMLLKKKLAELDNANKTLQAKFGALETESGSQARKLTALGQSSSELTALQSAYKARNNENVDLKKEIAGLKTKLNSLQISSSLSGAQNKDIVNDLKMELAALDNAHKTLKTQLSTAESSAGSQARKLTALGQSATELTALQSAYKERNNENADLKKQFASLNTKFGSLQTSSSLKGAQDQNIIDALKKKLAALDDAHITLKTQLATAETNAGSQARKLTALGQSATELTAIQSAYKERNAENESLKEQLANIKGAANECKMSSAMLMKEIAATEDKRKSLLAKISILETTSSNQARKITALMATTNELRSLKSAYDDLNNKKGELKSKLTAATADTDQDGVLDKSDKCPFSLAGTEVNAQGCFADADYDGVTNSKDECPTSPVNSHVNEKGCPKIKDADADGVADADDLCKSTTAGTTVNQFGCAPTENINLKGVNFATGSAWLTKASFPILDAAAETLKKSPGLKVEIAGYTDNKGKPSLNKRLSQRRANTVMIYLIKNGVDVAGLSAKGYGEENPIASNDNEQGRATNRRVELKIK